MSWSGPVAGAAPYQTPPYANGQPGYGQHSSYQYGQQPPYGQYQTGPSYSGPQQRPQDNRPPKKRGNPIITRYPPPPGYRGPAQPQGLFNAHQQPGQYQPPPQPGFPQAPPVQPNYPVQGYLPQSYGPPQPPSYPPSYSQAPNYQWPQQSYQPHQAPQSSVYPGTQGYAAPSTSYQPYLSQTAALDPSQQAYSQAPGWPQAQSQGPYPLQSQYNAYNGSATHDHPMLDSNKTPTSATTHPVSAPLASSHPPIGAPLDKATGNKPEIYLAWDDWDFDFDGAIWPKSNEPVDPNLSLGVIIWHPAKQVTRALPSTFEEAEEQSLKPAPEKLGNGESVSIYFTAENSHEAFLDVRQTDEWEYIQDDPAFVLFTDEEMQNNLVPVEDCIAQRDRPDEPIDVNVKAEDAEMHEPDWCVMDHLEQALSGGGEDIKSADLVREPSPAKPQTQEDILASLGVTGLPKPVSAEPVSFLMPIPEKKSPVPLPEKREASLQPPATSWSQPESQRSQSLGCPRTNGHPTATQRLNVSSSSSNNGRPPPPPEHVQEQDRERDREHNQYDPWNHSNQQQQYRKNDFSGGLSSPAQSSASNGTAAGSDFETEKPAEASEYSTTPVSKFERSDSSISRKRSYGDTDADDDRLRQHDDHTKRKRRSQADTAYGRR